MIYEKRAPFPFLFLSDLTIIFFSFSFVENKVKTATNKSLSAGLLLCL